MMRLKSISLHGFRSIRRLADFELKPLNVLIGANGSGKSNFSNFFRMLGQIAANGLQLWTARQGGASALLSDGPGVTPELTFHLALASETSGQYDYKVTLIHSAGDTFVFAKESYLGPLPDSPSSGRLGAAWLEGGHREALLLDGTDSRRSLRQVLQSYRVYQFHNTTETARIRQRAQLHDGDSLKEDGGNLAAVLYRYKTASQKYYQRIVETLRQVVPCFADFHLEPDGDSLLLRWRERGTDVTFGPHQASDGTLRLMALTTLLLQPRAALPPALILDEPELGLHPAAITLVAGLLRTAARDCQVIVATQSIPLLDQFDVGDVVTVNRRGRESVFERPDPERLREWLEAYSLGELWQKNVLTAGPFA